MVKLGRPFSAFSSRLKAIARSSIAQVKLAPSEAAEAARSKVTPSTSKVAQSASKVAQSASTVARSTAKAARSAVARAGVTRAKIAQSAVARSMAAGARAAQVRVASSTVAVASVVWTKIAQSRAAARVTVAWAAVARWTVARATAAWATVAQSRLGQWLAARARVTGQRIARSKVVTTVSSRLAAFSAGVTRRLNSSAKVRAFSSASPKVKAIAVGVALAFVTGVAAPAIAATTGGSPADQVAATAQDTRTQAADRFARPEPGNATAKQGTAKQGTATQAAPAVAAPSVAELHPVGIQGSQIGFTPTTDQMRNAQKIIQVGQSMGLPPRAWVIAVATSLQETTLNNYGDLGASNDHDSLGLFQQRPTSGWGSPSQLQNPTYAARAFYKALTQVHNWDRLPLTDAAQAVQVSAFPDHYAKWEAHAGDIVDAFYGQGPLVEVAHKVM